MTADERVHKKASFAPKVSVVKLDNGNHAATGAVQAPLQAEAAAAAAPQLLPRPASSSSIDNELQPVASPGGVDLKRDIYSIHGEQVRAGCSSL
jgi:hypothetical protein